VLSSLIFYRNDLKCLTKTATILSVQEMFQQCLNFQFWDKKRKYVNNLTASSQFGNLEIIKQL